MQEGIRIIETGNSEVIIKKSRFLGTAINVESEEEAREIVASIRKEHYSARHVCYAYSIGDTNPSLKINIKMQHIIVMHILLMIIKNQVMMVNLVEQQESQSLKL